MSSKSILFLVLFLSFTQIASANVIWTIGEDDNSSSELALGPSDYENFLSEDFGFEDKYYLIGHSNPGKDFPYVLPGPNDTWGGTWGTSGWRTHEVNILFGLEDITTSNGEWKVIIDLIDAHPEKSLMKVSINSQHEKFLLQGGSKEALTDPSKGTERVLEIPIDKEMIKEGGNKITITILEGSWVVFDQIRLEGPENYSLEKPRSAFIRGAEVADYEIETNGVRYQPLLVDVEHLKGEPQIEVTVDGDRVFREKIESDRYIYEVPMEAVERETNSTYRIYVDGELSRSGEVTRSAQELNTPADYVDTMIGAAHSRWMIAPGPWMPFSMVKLSPDNQNSGWQAGYQPSFETVGTFSHIHEWTMAGLGMMPVNGPLQINIGDQFKPDSGYRSRIDKATEEAPLGYYKVDLTDYGITAEVTATTRAGFQRYTFPEDTSSRIMIDLQIPAEYEYQLEEVEISKVSDRRIEGYSKQLSPQVWSEDADQEYVVNFVIEFDQPIDNIGGWVNDSLKNSDSIRGKDLKDAGLYVEFDTRENNVVQARSGISLVSIENASENLETEISEPFGWSFEAIVDHQKEEWNKLLSRIDITTRNRMEKERFYTNMYRALASRNIWSDVNGEWVDATEEVRHLHDPNSVALGCDAFWNTFWNLNQLWNLITPEWSSRWVKSQLAMYDANGWLAKGPAGMEYIPVMVAEHEIPLIIGAYQMGIRDYDVEKAFEAVYKTQTTPAQTVGDGLAGNRYLEEYLEYEYVPYDKGRFSNTLEYSFDDWSVAQFAKALGKDEAYKEFSERGSWWKNVIDEKTGFARMKDSEGNWIKDFDPYQTGRNEHYVEGNAWQLTYFVPQDIPGLAKKIGTDRFIKRLNWGFEESYKLRFNAPNDQYWDYPVIQGNQQSMHFSHLFNWVGRPWLTQKWSRAVMDRYYGYGIANAYLGDEDQGQMSAWFIMNAIGLFQTDGGASAKPVYEIGSPLFERIELDLGGRYNRGEKFIIEAKNTSRHNKYVQKAILNGEELSSFKFPAEELLKGGKLILQMGPQPNKLWGIENTGKD